MYNNTILYILFYTFNRIANNYKMFSSLEIATYRYFSPVYNNTG